MQIPQLFVAFFYRRPCQVCTIELTVNHESHSFLVCASASCTCSLIVALFAPQMSAIRKDNSFNEISIAV